MKKTIAALMALTLTFSLSVPVHAEAPGIAARSCVLIHADTGLTLYEHNADAQMLIASTTKIMTAIVVLENCSLDDVVTIGAESAGVEGSSMYLKAGADYTVEQLLYGMMLASGNDAATALAIHAAGSVEDFAELMNAKAEELGMENSSFKNPHGLDAEGHYSTARDMAKLMAYCVTNKDFVRIAGTESYNVGELTYVNHNKLLSMCDGCLCGKTGYTEAAGRSLVSCAERDGARLICVTLGDPNDWDDHCDLYDWGFSRCGMRTVVDMDMVHNVPLVSGVEASVTVRPEHELKVFLPEGAKPEISVELPNFAFAPAIEGARVGRVVVNCNGVELGSCNLVYSADVPRDFDLKLTPLERMVRTLALAGRHYGIPYYLTGE